jgi:hypothetical protein
MLSNRKAVAWAAIVMMVAMGSFLALTPAYYVMQARASGYRYHEWLSACAAAPGGRPYRQGYVYDESGALAAFVAANKSGGARIELTAPTWRVYRYQTTDLTDCGDDDGLYLARKIGLAVKEK